MAPISYRKHLGRDKFGAQFSLLKTQQYTDPATRTLTPTMYVVRMQALHCRKTWGRTGSTIRLIYPVFRSQSPNNLMERLGWADRDGRQRQDSAGMEP